MEKIKTNYISLTLTNVCTLNCKLCSAGQPYYKEYKHTELEITLESIRKLFEIYEYIETLDLSGGEPLTYPHINDVVKELIKNRDSIGNIRIVTNGTIIPSEELLKLMASDGKCIFMLDDYGKLSTNSEKVLSLIKENNIRLKLNLYHGDNQLFGGWVNMGDFSERGESKETVNEKFKTCHASTWMCLAMKNGRLYQCSHAIAANELGYCEFDKEEGIDLLDDSIALEEKIERALKFGKIAVGACRRCNGFDCENGERFPAAEQVK